MQNVNIHVTYLLQIIRNYIEISLHIVSYISKKLLQKSYFTVLVLLIDIYKPALMK